MPNAPASRSAPGMRFTCPMHPEVQAEKPGSCPKCGMALEPVEISQGKRKLYGNPKTSCHAG
jgi:hypothetical protein